MSGHDDDDDSLTRCIRQHRAICDEFSPLTKVKLMSCPKNCMSCVSAEMDSTEYDIVNIVCQSCKTKWSVCKKCPNMRKQLNNSSAVQAHIARYHNLSQEETDILDSVDIDDIWDTSGGADIDDIWDTSLHMLDNNEGGHDFSDNTKDESDFSWNVIENGSSIDWNCIYWS